MQVFWRCMNVLVIRSKVSKSTEKTAAATMRLTKSSPEFHSTSSSFEKQNYEFDSEEPRLTGEHNREMLERTHGEREKCLGYVYLYPSLQEGTFWVKNIFGKEWCPGSWRGRPVTVKVLNKNCDFGLRAKENLKNIIILKEHPGIPVLFDIAEDARHYYFVAQKAECTLRDLIHIKHPAFDVTDEMRDCQETVHVDSAVMNTCFWDRHHVPLPPAYQLIRGILLGLVYLNTKHLSHQNICMENMLVYVTNLELCGRIWPVDAIKNDDLCERAILNTAGRVFHEFLTGGKKMRGDFSMIANFPDAVGFIQLLVGNEAPKNLNKILAHPIFWSVRWQLDFISSIANFLNCVRFSKNSSIREKLVYLGVAILNGTPWGGCLPHDTCFILNRRGYNVSKLTDLVRLLRNIHSHPEDLFLKGICDVHGEKLYMAIRKRFPNFLSELYNFATDESTPDEFSSIVVESFKETMGRGRGFFSSYF